MITKSFSLSHTFTYKNEVYIFDPFANGMGLWKLKDEVVSIQLQEQLNSLFFGKPKLPSMIERFKIAFESSNKTEISNLKQISYNWLHKKILGIQTTNNIQYNYMLTKSFIIGRMYFFTYSAKYKDSLSIWDTFPLVIPLEIYQDGFLGINLHYLDIISRTELLIALISKYGKLENDILSAAVTYKLFSNLSKINQYSVCIKRYLFDNIPSRILLVEPHEWAYAIGIPVQNFKFNEKKKNARTKHK